MYLIQCVHNSCRRGTDGPGSQLEAGKVVRIGRCSEICEIDGRLRTDRYTRVPVGVSARGQYQGKMNVWCYIHLCERTAGGCVEYHPTCQTNSRGMWIIEINALLVTSIIVDSVPARARAWGGRSRWKKATLGTGCAQEGKGEDMITSR